MIGPGEKRMHGQLKLQAPADTVCTLADTYYKIAGNMSDGCECGFVVATNKLRYTGPSGVVFLFNGASDLRVSKTTEITYGLHIDGVLVPGAETPHTFTAAAKTSSIGITALCELTQDSELDVYMKSSEAGLTASVQSLNITFWG